MIKSLNPFSSSFLLLSQPLGSLEGRLAKMLNWLFPIPTLRPGDTGHLLTEGVNLAGAAGGVGLVVCPADLGKNLSNCVGDGLLAKIHPGLIHPRARPQLSPGVNMDCRCPAATAKQAIIWWWFQTIAAALLHWTGLIVLIEITFRKFEFDNLLGAQSILARLEIPIEAGIDGASQSKLEAQPLHEPFDLIELMLIQRHSLGFEFERKTSAPQEFDPLEEPLEGARDLRGAIKRLFCGSMTADVNGEGRILL